MKINAVSICGMLLVTVLVSLVHVNLCDSAPGGRKTRHYRKNVKFSHHTGGRRRVGGRAGAGGGEEASQETDMQRLLRQMTGRWNNRQQVTDEKIRVTAPKQHPLFRATIAHVTTGLFRDPQEVLFVQNDLYVGQGLQKTPNLMVLHSEDGGIAMRAYAFSDASLVVDKWQEPDLFSNLKEEDLIDLGSACRQFWLPDQDGGFLAWTTQGECNIQMGKMSVKLDIGTQSSEKWIALKYNMYLPDGTPLMSWPEPFNFTRIPDGAYDEVIQALMRGDEIFYRLDLNACSSHQSSVNHEHSSLISSLGVVSGRLDHFKIIQQESSEYLHFSTAVDMMLINRISETVLEFLYHSDEEVRLLIRGTSSAGSLTLSCDSLNPNREAVFRVAEPLFSGKQLTDYKTLLSVARWGEQMRLILDHPSEACEGELVEHLQGFGTHVKSFSSDDFEVSIQMTSMWISYDVTSCHVGSELLNTLRMFIPRTEGVIELHYSVIDLATMEECLSTKVTCSVSQSSDVPGIHLYAI